MTLNLLKRAEKGSALTATEFDQNYTDTETEVNATIAALAAKAPLSSPALTGTPTAPTASGGTNTTQIATTAFVAAAVTGGSIADGDKGDIVVSGSGTVWTVDAGAVTLAKQANLAADTIIGRANGGGTGVPQALTATQVRTILNVANGATAVTFASEAEVQTGTEAAKAIAPDQLKPREAWVYALSDESTALTTGTSKLTVRAPYAFKLAAVRSSVKTAPTGSTLIVDINVSGSTILSTKLSIDASEKTSTTAASAAVISSAAIADDAEITFDIDQIGSTVAGAGLKVYLIGNRD